jgi:hypothetical protein
LPAVRIADAVLGAARRENANARPRSVHSV